MKKLTVFCFTFICFSIVLGVFHPLIKSEGLSGESFYFQKIFSSNKNLIVAGDSRVNNAVNPKVFLNLEGIERVLNFSFPAVVYSAEYLDAIEERLIASGKRIVILGITPLSLSPKNETFNRFTTKMDTAWPMKYARFYLGPLLDFFKSYPTEDEFYYQLLRGKWKKTLGRAVNHESGWSEVYLQEKDEHNLEGTLKNWKNGNQVSRRIIHNLVTRIRQWRSEKIEVFIFYPPTSEEFDFSEKLLSKFSKRTELSLLRSGAKILPVSGEYSSIDGHHLDGNGALKFSEYLLRQVQSYSSM